MLDRKVKHENIGENMKHQIYKNSTETEKKYRLGKIITLAIVLMMPLAYLPTITPAWAAPTATLSSRAPAVIGLGQGGVVIAAITIVNDAVAADTLTTVKLHLAGTALSGSDIVDVKLWKDSDVDGVPDATEVLGAKSGTQTDETFSFTGLTASVAASGNTYLLVTATISSSAVAGRTVAFSFTAAADVVLTTGGSIAVVGNTDTTKGTISTTTSGSMTATGYKGKDAKDDTASNNLLVKGANVGLSIMKLAASGVSVNVTKIKVTVVVTTATTVENVISDLKIYKDDGTFSTTTGALNAGGLGSELAGTWAAWSPTTDATTKTRILTISGGLVIAAGSSQVLHIAVPIRTDATASATITAYVASSAGAWGDITAVSGGTIVVAGATPSSTGTWPSGAIAAGTAAASGTIAVTVADGADAALAPVAGQSTFDEMKLTLTPSGEAMTVNTIKVTLVGTVVPVDILRIRVYDAKTDGTINTASEITTTQGAWSSAVAGASSTLTLSKVISSATVIHVTFDLSTTATAGNTVGASIAAAADVKAKGSTSAATLSSTGTGTTTITTSAIVASGTLAVTVDTATPSAAAFVTIGNTKTIALKVTLTAATENVTISKIKFTVPTTVIGVPADISAVKIYNSTLSSTGALQYEIASTAGSWVGTTQPYTIQLTMTGGLNIEKATTKVIYVGLDIADSATIVPLVHTLRIGIAAAADVTAKGVWSTATITPTLTGTYPTNALTVKGKLVVTGVSQITSGASTSQSQANIDMLKLTLTATGEALTVTDISVALIGLSTSADIATSGVKLYEDSAGAIGTLITTGSVSGTTTAFTSLTISVPAGTSKVIHVTYTIAAAAVEGHTVGAEITASTSVAATGATSGDTAIRPSSFTKISSELLTIQTGATVAYSAGTLRPSAVAPNVWTTANATAATFTIQVTKAGTAGINFNSATSYITFTDGFVVYTGLLASGTSIPSGSTTTTLFTLSFSGSMPNMRENTATNYTVTVHLRGTDTNGATFTQADFVLPNTNGIGNNGIRVDNTAPTVTHAAVTSASAGSTVTISATITDAASGVSGATLSYRKSGTTDWSSTVMTQAGTNAYVASIPSTTVAAPGVEYYMTATDNAGAVRTTSTNTITVAAPDTAVPTITHTAVTTAVVGNAITVSATVTDNVAVSVVHLRYRVVGISAFTEVTMTATANVYSATIPAADVTTAGVEYYIHAVDTSNLESTSGSATTPNSVKVTTYAVPSSTPSRVNPVTGASISSNVTVGSTVGASTAVSNLGSTSRTVQIFFVVEKDGVPVQYGSSKVTLTAGQSFEPTAGWVLAEKGNYTIRITVTDSSTGVTLSEEQTLTYTVA